MTRVKQPHGTKGSLKWIQLLINDHPDLLNRKLFHAVRLLEPSRIEWRSPLKSDDFAEYRDAPFLKRLGVTLNNRSLPPFWPERGPQWDALGRTAKGDLFLVEAKAHIKELLSDGSRASEKSKALIDESLQEVREFLRIPAGVEWSAKLYQYANRLAHLYLLRGLNKLPAYLVFVYFVGDKEMQGPGSAAEWQAAIRVLKGVLGLDERHRLGRYVADVFIDVKDLR